MRGIRLKADADWADSFLGINQAQRHVQPGHRTGSGRTDPNGNPLLPSRRPVPGRSISPRSRATLAARSRCSASFSAFFAAYGQYAFTPLLVPEQCGYGGRFFGRAFDPVAVARRQLLDGARRAALRHSDHRWQAADARAGLRLRRSRRDSTTSTPRTRHARSVRRAPRPASACALGWEDIYSADLSVAKAIDGPARRLARLLHPRREVLSGDHDAHASALSCSPRRR